MNKKSLTVLSLVCFIFLVHCICLAGTLDDVLKGAGISKTSGANSPDESTTISGLKEALSIGSKNAVTSVSGMDGYFKNQFIKILVPENIRTIVNVLGKMGYQQQVDAFVLSMNRAAENAAPKAQQYFIDAIKGMTIQDAAKIIRGGNTSATEYFKSKTRDKLYGEFKPSVSESMNKVGVTKSYKQMVGTYTSAVPFASVEGLDLDHYVTTKALDGLFYMIGEEEKKIRTQPAARVTELLKTVFGK